MSQGRGIGGHTSAVRGASDDWLTPPEIVKKLGPFDLDPCASISQPWVTAEKMLTIDDNGLWADWTGYVWCNPPYGPQVGEWMGKLATHGNGIGLIFARTETKEFHRQVWNRANALFFFAGRLFFHQPITGKRAAHNAGGPSVLVAYGNYAVERLRAFDMPGKFIALDR